MNDCVFSFPLAIDGSICFDLLGATSRGLVCLQRRHQPAAKCMRIYTFAKFLARGWVNNWNIKRYTVTHSAQPMRFIRKNILKTRCNSRKAAGVAGVTVWLTLSSHAIDTYPPAEDVSQPKDVQWPASLWYQSPPPPCRPRELLHAFCVCAARVLCVKMPCNLQAPLTSILLQQVTPELSNPLSHSVIHWCIYLMSV